jgi:MFS family permease
MPQDAQASELHRVITPPPFAVAGLILSMALVAIGNGLIFAYVPVRLGGLGYPPSMAGWILTGMAAGGFLGCLTVGPMVKRVGHARAFMTLAAVMLLTHLLIGLTIDPILWIGARFAYGFAVTGLFIIAQSWMNDSCPNEWRGRVMAIFYMSYVLCIGLGGYMIAWIDLSTPTGPMIAVLFGTLAILPVGLTNLPSPPPPEAVSIALRAVWRISPVGLVGLLAVGGLTMMVQGFAPIYAQATGYSQSDIGLLAFLMQFGMIAVQMPLGALSDRMDRRIILIVACVIIVIFALICTQLEGANLWLMIVLFGIWAGATETIYAVATAHANDRAEPQYYVALSMTMLFAWSASAFILPGATTLLTSALGVTAYMYVAVAIAFSYGLFVAYRMMRRDPVPEGEQEAYEPRAAQAAYAPDLAAPVVAEDISQQMPE